MSSATLKQQVAVEVLRPARSYVARQLVSLGGDPNYRENFISDHDNIILDVLHLPLSDPLAMEQKIKLLPGVVSCGIFANSRPDQILVGAAQGCYDLLQQINNN